MVAARRSHLADLLLIAAAASIITLVIAAPVLRAPSRLIFGPAIAGLHHDPFTAMEQFARPLSLNVYLQAVTDVEGAVFARVFGPVAAYNVVVLLSFPLAAIGAFALARHLGIPRAGATLAALVFAFSPFHLAHAAYHPHVAQVQWLPLYLLALWRCVDRPSLSTVAWLTAATGAVTLSNFYGGLIAAVVTPVALVAYWTATRRRSPDAWRRLWLTSAALAVLAVIGAVYARAVATDAFVAGSKAAFPLSDVFLHSAQWLSYVVPPVEHPWLGEFAQHRWRSAGVTLGIVEHQAYLGVGVLVLAVLAFVVTKDNERRGRALPIALVTIAAAALACSLSPVWTIGSWSLPRPSGLLHAIVPVFRSYARFAVIVQLMAALLAGAGFAALVASRSLRGRVAAAVLVMLVLFEYAVSPRALARDVLPTPAHRWAAEQGQRVLVLDCTPLTDTSSSVRWLTGGRVDLLGGRFADCSEPSADLAHKLAAAGFTHLLVRDDSADARPFGGGWRLDGFGEAMRFAGAQLLPVRIDRPSVYTAEMSGVSPREYDRTRSWRWMVTDATWAVINPAAEAMTATLEVELTAFAGDRQLDVRLDGHPLKTLDVSPSPRLYSLGPVTLSPGAHQLTFHAIDESSAASVARPSSDGRALLVAFGEWQWRSQRERP